ncbi:hypothetical protein DI270_013905 [Microbispora triticiradicis]|uniref:Uncharacterized protein n=3 Tax=Microbispora TaxID=2005 RepID=A0ABY3LSQ5_9ACTN|nr:MULTISPECIES: hypothetical protein [Microbispora]RGA04394.1 hypothetical protein DI270_013905 [Microbispora triticiradicis]TLP64094.1 hypothetical protein FED44_07835 [Microbispora fusca]TYB50904.1 hypothetical protein FXF59_27605 [Microbispora tritici]GLW20026.1 hypothetical protein Mame01_00690 [Microbispora amethystogenes]
MGPARRYALTVLALAALLLTPLGVTAAWASGTGPAGSFRTSEWKVLPEGVATANSAVAAETSYCIPVAGPGVQMTFYCDIKQLSTLKVYCTGVTVIITLNVGRWAPSGSCPGYSGYTLQPRV